ncbi:MAG: hypothetical protein H0Z33_08660 [Bacillaceae bacterium]|nr:hypothetical protein [Bacillaceae bacterium]
MSMKLKKRLWIPGVIALLVLMSPTMTLACQEQDVFSTETTTQQQKQKEKHPDEKDRHMMKWEQHQEMYYLLLSEKYTADDLNMWKETLSQRKSLINEMKKLKQEGKIRENCMKGHQKMKDFMVQYKETYREFTRAVSTKDDDAIRQELPKLLDQMKTMNTHLEQKLEACK